MLHPLRDPVEETVPFRLCADLTRTASGEKSREWTLALDELNETAGLDPEVLILGLPDGLPGLVFEADEPTEPVTLFTDPLRRAMQRYRRSIFRLSRSCASAGSIEAGALKKLDTAKRDAHDTGAQVLGALLSPNLQLSHPCARQLFSLLYLIWDPSTGHELTLHHHL